MGTTIIPRGCHFVLRLYSSTMDMRLYGYRAATEFFIYSLSNKWPESHLILLLSPNICTFSDTDQSSMSQNFHPLQILPLWSGEPKNSKFTFSFQLHYSQSKLNKKAQKIINWSLPWPWNRCTNAFRRGCLKVICLGHPVLVAQKLSSQKQRNLLKSFKKSLNGILCCNFWQLQRAHNLLLGSGISFLEDTWNNGGVSLATVRNSWIAMAAKGGLKGIGAPCFQSQRCSRSIYRCLLDGSRFWWFIFLKLHHQKTCFRMK